MTALASVRRLRVMRPTMPVRRLASRLRARYRAEGAHGLLSILLDNLYWKHTLLRFSIAVGGRDRVLEAPPGFEGRLGTLKELIHVREAWPGPPLHVEFQLDEFTNLSRFYLGLWEGAIAHISWIFDHEHPSPLMRLRPGEAEVGYSRTLRQFLGRHTYSHVLAVILDDLACQGYSRIYAHVSPDNTPSLRAFTSVGFQPIGTVTWLHLLGTRRVVYISDTRCDGQRIPST